MRCRQKQKDGVGQASVAFVNYEECSNLFGSGERKTSPAGSSTIIILVVVRRKGHYLFFF